MTPARAGRPAASGPVAQALQCSGLAAFDVLSPKDHRARAIDPDRALSRLPGGQNRSDQKRRYCSGSVCVRARAFDSPCREGGFSTFFEWGKAPQKKNATRFPPPRSARHESLHLCLCIPRFRRDGMARRLKISPCALYGFASGGAEQREQGKQRNRLVHGVAPEVFHDITRRAAFGSPHVPINQPGPFALTPS